MLAFIRPTIQLLGHNMFNIIVRVITYIYIRTDDINYCPSPSVCGVLDLGYMSV